MKQFLLHLLFICIVSISSLYMLDYLFTTIYTNSKPRNKVSLAYQGKTKAYDVIFLGSSRANNHFVSQLFIDKGYTAFNYGMSGSRLEESALLLELLLDKGTKIESIVLEVDLNINSNGYSEGTRALFYPYLRQSKIISNYYQHIPEFNSLYNIPFYRYIKYDAKIGMRELFFTATSKPTKLLQSYGFYGLDNQGKKMSYDLSKSTPKRNEGYEKIKELCEINKIRLISVTTPMCENITNPNYFNEVVKLYPEVYNMENTITDESCFSSCGHMNKKGALLFTQKIFDKFFN